jgi:hypothetical protein
VASLACVAALASPAAAAGDGLKLGPVLAFPSLAVSETYDDNVFLASEDPTDDLITTVTPALRLKLPLDRFFFRLEGEASFVRYQDNSDEDSTDWSAGGAFGAAFPGGLDFEVSDTYRVQYLVRSQEFPTGETLDLNVARAKAGFAIRNAFKIDLAWTNNFYTFEQSTQRDRTENDAQLDLYWKFLPRTSALVEVGFTDYAYDSNTAQDNTAVNAGLGLTWDYTARSTGILKVGFQNKQYADENVALGIEDASYLIASVKVRHVFTRRTVGELEVSEASQESDFQDNPYYLRTGVGLGLTQHFTAKIYARLAGNYYRDAYPNDTTYVDVNDPRYDPAAPAAVTNTGSRTDSTIRGQVALGFDVLRWLNLELGYTGERRSSTFETFDFTDNRVAFTITAAF